VTGCSPSTSSRPRESEVDHGRRPCAKPLDYDELERWTRIGLSEVAQCGAGAGDIAMPPGHEGLEGTRCAITGLSAVYLRRAITTRPAKNSAAPKMIMPRPM
jgi:hypothetical protein